MNNYVKLQKLRENGHFKLAAPDAILAHLVDVVVNAHVIFNIETVDFLVRFETMDASLAQIKVLLLRAVELVS